MPRTRMFRRAKLWQQGMTTDAETRYIYGDDLYTAIVSTTDVPPTEGASDANYTLVPESPWPGPWSFSEADFGLYKMADLIRRWVAGNFVSSAYAAMSGGGSAITDVGAGWADVVNYAAQSVTPREVTVDLVAGTMAFQHSGVYRISFGVALTGHNSSNSGRNTSVRLYDATTGTPTGAIVVGIGRNTEDTFFATTFLAEVSPAEIGDAYLLQIGGGDDITSIDSTNVNFTANQVSEWQDPLPIIGS